VLVHLDTTPIREEKKKRRHLSDGGAGDQHSARYGGVFCCSVEGRTACVTLEPAVQLP